MANPPKRYIEVDFAKNHIVTIPTPGIEPEPRQKKRRILTTRPRGRSWRMLKIICLTLLLAESTSKRSISQPSKGIPGIQLYIKRSWQRSVHHWLWKFCYKHDKHWKSYLKAMANSFPRAKLEENFQLRGTDNVQGQRSEHTFKIILHNTRNFENWGIFNNYSMSARWIWDDR